MVLFSLLPALLLAADTSAVPVSEQQPLAFNAASSVGESSGGLTGRFLHITDFHPDTHYKPGKSIDNACHRGKGSAGYFGSEGTECDAPLSLIDETFRWIEQNLKGKIDFVIWTGDSARHDNDEKIPRSEEEVIHLNDLIARKFIDTFKKENSPRGLSIPIVPTIGNNDIMPHNIFEAAPNRWTRKYAEVWDKFIPEYQRHSFVEGGWFTTDVIPGKLAVISLNTMYFYESNSAVDGCDAKSEPGYEHMEWLRVQLKLLRTRNMKAILIGHVPPARSGTKRSWDETCWQKYTLWVHNYRDVIVGSAYGHMNIDHFMLQDSNKVKIAEGAVPPAISAQSRSSYLSSLREDWSKLPNPPQLSSKALDADDDWLTDEQDMNVENDDLESQKSKKKRFLKKIGGRWAERYSVTMVSPSLVPNYFPTLRVIEYNTTGLEGATAWADTYDDDTADLFDTDDADDDYTTDKKKKHKKKKDKKKKKKKKPHFKIPEPPSPSAPPGPAYSNQPLTWLSHTQYFANLTRINAEVPKVDELSANSTVNETNETSYDDIFTFEVEYDTKHDKLYKMKDLTVRSFFKLASRIAEKNSAKSSEQAEAEKKKHKNRTWRTFLKRAFVGLLDGDDLDDIED